MEDLKKYAPGLYDATVREKQRQQDANIAKFITDGFSLHLTRDVLDSIDLPLIPFKSNGKIGFIDGMCNIVIDPDYNEIRGTFRNRNSYVAVKKDKKWSIINAVGEELLSYTSSTVIPGYDTPITTIQNQTRTKVVNVLSGEVIVNGGYDYIGGFRYGFARVRKNGLWGIIDDKGQLVVETKYYDMYRFYEWDKPTTVVKESKNGPSLVINLLSLNNSQK